MQRVAPAAGAGACAPHALSRATAASSPAARRGAAAAARRVRCGAAFAGRAAIPRDLALSLDLAARRKTVEAQSHGHARELNPIEQGEAELFHAISVATHGGTPGPMSAAVVEVAAALALTALAARVVHWAAGRVGMAEEAERRGARAAEAISDLVSDAAPAAEEPVSDDVEGSDGEPMVHTAADAAAAPEDKEQEHAHSASPLLRAYFTRPATTLVWATGCCVAARAVLRASAATWHAGEPWVLLGMPALTLLAAMWRLALIACAAWALHLSNAAALERAAARHPRHAASYLALRDAVSRAVLVAASLAALSVLHVPLSAVLAFGGVGGIILGVGAQAAASNALSGAFLMLSHALHQGDDIELVGKGLAGTVVEMSLMTTTILSRDATCVSLPNSELAKTPLRNFSRARAVAVAGNYAVPAARLADVPNALRQMEAFLAAHPDVETAVARGRLRSAVTLGELRDGAVTLQARAYVATPGRSAADVERVRREVLLGLGAVITHDAGIPLALPTLAVVAPRRDEAAGALLPQLPVLPRQQRGVVAAAAAAARVRPRLLRRRARLVQGRPAGGAASAAAVCIDSAAASEGLKHPHEDLSFSWRGGELEEDEEGPDAVAR